MARIGASGSAATASPARAGRSALGPGGVLRLPAVVSAMTRRPAGMRGGRRGRRARGQSTLGRSGEGGLLSLDDLGFPVLIKTGLSGRKRASS
jgi:hypothetical protein